MRLIIALLIASLALSACERGSKLDRPINTIKNNCTKKQAKQGLCVRR